MKLTTPLIPSTLTLLSTLSRATATPYKLPTVDIPSTWTLNETLISRQQSSGGYVGVSDLAKLYQGGTLNGNSQCIYSSSCIKVAGVCNPNEDPCTATLWTDGGANSSTGLLGLVVACAAAVVML